MNKTLKSAAIAIAFAGVSALSLSTAFAADVVVTFDPNVVAYGYNTAGVASPSIELFFIAANGELTRTERFDAPYASMVHDFMLSKNFMMLVRRCVAEGTKTSSRASAGGRAA